METPEVDARKRPLILWVLALTVLVVIMDLTILNVALTTIQRELDASNADLQWSLDSYLITFAAFIFTMGVLADRFGRKRVLIACLVIFGITSLFAAQSGSIDQLIVWRALMGVGAAALPTVTLAILITVFPPAERPKAIAGWAGAAGIGTAFGPVVGGLLLEKFWWGSIFMINVPLVLVSLVLIIWLVPESRNPQHARFDPLGVLLSLLGVGSLTFGIVRGGEDNDWLAGDSIGPIAAGLVLLLVLVLTERRMATPALDVTLLGNTRFAAGTSVIALAFFALLGGIFVTAVYFQAVRGLEPAQAGLLMLPMGAAAFAVSFVIPRLIKRFGIRGVVAAGTLCMTASLAIFSVAVRDTPTVVLVAAQVLLGLGWGVVLAPATAALMSVVPMVKAGAGQAVANTVRQVAGALGVAVIGSILGVVYRDSLGNAADVLPAGSRDEATGSIGGALDVLGDGDVGGLRGQVFDAYHSGMQVALLICAGFALLAVLVALRLPGRPPAPPVAETPVSPAVPVEPEPAGRPQSVPRA
ncbi:MFS transporter [Micromonospora sp. DT228]|uniref:MFS transporter n=1 Tax=Micromonospora sp. DT228 TaxID=3393443 RepID=UPI003CED53A1